MNIPLSHCFIVLLVINLSLIFTPPVHAQNLTTQKRVVSNFKPSNFNTYFPFPTNECTDKIKGDANCDNQINSFDLSIWQIENATGQGRKADFNSDGLVSLVDYGIWKQTFYRSNPTPSSNTQAFTDFLKRIFNLDEAQAQTATNLTNSQSVVSSNNTSYILNQNPDDTTSQIQFDANSNPVSLLLIDSEGNPQAQSTFLRSGDELVTAFQDGIAIQTLKTAEGPVFQIFKGESGNVIAVKSWPTLKSLENNDPPLSVTLPTKNNKYLTLNISPNGTSIIAQTDSNGNILSQSQLKPNGIYVSQDLQRNIITETNSKTGLATIQIPNNLGGSTTYHFINSALFALVQIDKDNNYYIAKPLNTDGSSWNLASTISGGTTEKIVSDPISEIGSNTPNPNELIGDINYYLGVPQNTNALNFRDGFGSSPKILPAQVDLANKVLTIDSASAPATQTGWIFGIKEALAASLDSDEYTPPEENDDNESNRRRTGDDDDNRSNSSSAAAAAAPAANQPARVASANTGNVTVGPDGTQTAQATDANGRTVTGTTGQGGTSAQANFDVISRFIPSTTSNGTPVLGTPVIENTYHSLSSCFLAGTKISTPEGPVAIEILRPGMKVYSFNELTNQKEIADFMGVDINFVDEYLIINNRIRTTTYHPFYTVSNGLLTLIKAGKLKVGDLLVNEAGSYIPIISIQRIANKETVYNLLTVTPNNNFYAEGILVHNYNNDMGDDKANGDTSVNNNDISQSFDSGGNQEL